jgi:hypothetical protein
MTYPKYVVSYSAYCGCPAHDSLGSASLKKIFTNKELFEFILESINEFEITDILPITTELVPSIEYRTGRHCVEYVKLNIPDEPQLFFPWKITKREVTDCLDDIIGIPEAMERISTI